MRKNGLFFISSMIFILFLLFTSCEHRPLVEQNNMHYVRIYLDEKLRNVNFGFYDETKKKPEYSTPQIPLCYNSTI